MNMKYIYTITFGLILTALAVAIGAAKAATFPTHVLEQATSNVYMIDSVSHTGTGVWITPNLILTNCHVAGEDRDVHMTAYRYDGSQAYIVKMVLCDKANDLAIMESARPNRSVIPTTLADERIPLGKDIFSAGYGMGGGFSLKAGISGMDYDVTRRGMTLPTAGPGDSGSPIYNEKGQLVGVLNSGLQTRGGMPLLGKAFFIKLDVVRNYLSNLLSKVDRAKGTGQ